MKTRRGFLQNVLASVASVCVVTFVPGFVESKVIDYSADEAKIFFYINWEGEVKESFLSYSDIKMMSNKKNTLL